MISSCMCSSAPPVANASEITGMTSDSRPRRSRSSASIPRVSAPVFSTTAKAPPTRNTKKMTSAASIIPCGMATTASKGPTGCGDTVW